MRTAKWEGVGRPAPQSLTGARLLLHWAAQVPAAVGHTFLAPTPDDSQSTLQWDPAHRMLVGQPVGTKRPVRAALDLSSLSLVLLETGDERLADFTLDGKTLDEAYEWMGAVASRFSEGVEGPLQRRDYDLPSHGVATGAEFTRGPSAEFEECTRWYANAHHALSRVKAKAVNASPVRCWPHHFDIATLITLDSEREDEQSRSINVGLSPGDGNYDEPYFYVNPWPQPEEPVLSALAAGGHWHTEGWLGAVLPASDLVAAGSEAGQQADRVDRFLSSALAAATRMLMPPAR
ncbi:MAG: hypothetical protein HKM89_11020 [Gemmatimonadales bacterium]|nr:hypothetical protein [Gemmatimonadales bacterium]